MSLAPSLLPQAALLAIGVGGPALLLAVLAASSLVGRPLPERWTARLTAGSMLAALAAFGLGLAGTLTGRHEPGLLSYGAWSTARPGGIALEFLVDPLALAFGMLTAGIAGVVSAFSNRYLHRESGYQRYFVLLALFVLGLLLVALAGNIEVLFVGWEFVGLSSALLVGFFHDRRAPVENALRVFAVYRVSDAAMLSAAVLLHHVAGTDSLSLLFGGSPTATALPGPAARGIALLLIVAVAGKSALLPFSGWLPRAMEGPTPSSAVYYGALSIHAGCFLLLRAAPLLERVPEARALAALLGAATAVFAGLTARVQSDVKSALAYAALTQVSIVVIEIALGFYTLAFLHLAGHACFRLLQFLSAPNVLHDLHALEERLGTRPIPGPGAVGVLAPLRLRDPVYLLALERGFLDSALDRVLVAPFVRAARWLTRLDGRLCAAVLPREGLGPAPGPPGPGGEADE